jgi:energy-coupling factor transporter ATP-binding protein EcfA2
VLQDSISRLAPLFNPLNEDEEEEGHYREEFAELLKTPPPVVANDSSLKATGFSFIVAGLTFKLCQAPALLMKEFSDLCAENNLATAQAIRCYLNVFSDDDGATYQIACNGRVLKKALPYNCILPVLMDIIQILSYQSNDYLIAVHAAVVVKDKQALVLPGISGSGKSTLCVSLLQQGYQCYSDELTVFARSNNSVTPLPLPMAVKTGSWPILNADWPILDNATIWHRVDGRQLKYLPLRPPHFPIENPAFDAAIEVQRVIFPHYDAHCTKPSLKIIDPVQLLMGLTRAGYQIKADLTADKVKQLLCLVQQMPAYELHYATLSQAQCLLSTIID